MSTLRASVSAWESGPVITLSGEADITTAAELSELTLFPGRILAAHVRSTRPLLRTS